MMLDIILGMILLCFIIDSNEGVYDCSPKLFLVGASFLIYQCCFILRNVFIITVCFFSKRPSDYSVMTRVFFNFVDTILLTALVSWNTYVMTLEETTVCKDESSKMYKYWIICLVFLIFYWFMVAGMTCLWGLICAFASCICCMVAAGSRPPQQAQNIMKHFEDKQKLFTELTSKQRED